MRLHKDIENIAREDKLNAKIIMDKLKMGGRVFGNPALGLKQTLKKLENNHEEEMKNKDALEFLDNDGEFKSLRAKLKAGINGEETLAEYFEKVIKYDKKLQDIILFASLSDPEQNSGGDEYISDSDFVAVYGNNILIIDAKNIVTNPEIPIYLVGNELVSVGNTSILTLHPSTHIWQNVFKKNNIHYDSLHGCVVIVNNTGALVWKNKDWQVSEVKPIHISGLVEFLHDWIQDKDNEVNLSLLVSLMKMQIKDEDSNTTIRDAMRRCGI